MTVAFFQQLMQRMGGMKHDFEMRRVLFGLGAIVGMPPQALPQLVSERMPDIVRQVTQLSVRMREKRLQVLRDNEKHLAEEGRKLEQRRSGDGFEDVESSDEEDSDDSDEEEKQFRRDVQEIQKLRKKEEKRGAQPMEEDDEASDSGEDSDYEYLGGDMALYDAALDDVDELLLVKDTLERLSQADGGYFAHVMGSLGAQERADFTACMEEAPALKEREDLVRKQCDALEEKLRFTD